MATSIPPSDTKLDDEDTEAKIECDNCHDHFLTEFMVNMDGIADGHTKPLLSRSRPQTLKPLQRYRLVTQPICMG